MFNDVDGRLAAAESALIGDSVTRDKLKVAAAVWDAAVEENRKKYGEAKGRAAENETALKQIRTWSVDRGNSSRPLQLAIAESPNLEIRRSERGASAGVAGDSRRANEALGRAVSHAERAVMGLLRATVQRGTGTAHIAAALRELVKGSKMRTEKLISSSEPSWLKRTLWQRGSKSSASCAP